MPISELNFWDFAYHYNHGLDQWVLVVTEDEHIYGYYDTLEDCDRVRDYLLYEHEGECIPEDEFHTFKR